jgi:hypothetical protein
MNLNEQEIIRRFIDVFTAKSKSVYGMSLTVRNLRIEKPVSTDDFKDYKDGISSTDTEVNFELSGWKSYAEDGIKNFMVSLLDDEDIFAPIVNVEIYELNSKGKTSVKAVFSIVYTRYEIRTDDKVKNDIKSGDLSRDRIIDEIELRLSEIYTLLKKLRD